MTVPLHVVIVVRGWMTGVSSGGGVCGYGDGSSGDGYGDAGDEGNCLYIL